MKNSGAHHAGCLLCGDQHPCSWRLDFTSSAQGGVQATFVGNQKFQDYAILLHWGVIAALIDEAMAHWLFALGIEAVTSDLRIRYRQPIACNASLDLHAWLVFSCPPLYDLRAEARYEGQLMTNAEAKFMRRDRS